jgi:hypothetical protein
VTNVFAIEQLLSDLLTEFVAVARIIFNSGIALTPEDVPGDHQPRLDHAEGHHWLALIHRKWCAVY